MVEQRRTSAIVAAFIFVCVESVKEVWQFIRCMLKCHTEHTDITKAANSCPVGYFYCYL